MKGLFIANFDFNEKIMVGVKKKVEWMYDAFKDNNVDIDLFYRDGYYIKLKTFLRNEQKIYSNKLQQYTYLLSIIDKNKYDFIFIRYTKSDYFFIWFLENIKKIYNNIKIIIEFPTLPYDEEVENQRILNIDKFFRNYLKEYADFAVTYNNVKDAYGIKNIFIGNGIEVKSIYSLESINNNIDTCTMIGVANVSFWHGFDRVIKGIRKYYDRNPSIEVQFIIVGEGKELNNLIKLSKELKLEENIIFTGYKTGEELVKLYETADVAIGALAWFRKGLIDGSAIKNREYCALGIPFVYSGYDIDFENFEYSLKIDDNESAIDINYVIDFIRIIKSKDNYRNSMRKYAEEKLGWNTKIKYVLDSVYK